MHTITLFISCFCHQLVDITSHHEMVPSGIPLATCNVISVRAVYIPGSPLLIIPV